MLLWLHHCRHSPQLASCVKDLGPKIFRAGCGMNRIGCSMNKNGWFIKSKHSAGYTRCVPEQNRVVRGEHFLGAVIGAVLRIRTPKKRFGVLRAHKEQWVQRQNAFWRRFADVRKRAPSRKRRYPILFRNYPGIPDFVNFPFFLLFFNAARRKAAGLCSRAAER